MNDLQRLKEMGISVWGLRRPELYPDLKLETVSLPASCKLLFVCNEHPNAKEAWLFGKIMASIKLSPEQALRLPSAALPYIGEHSLEWCWFAGMKMNESTLEGVKQLTSPALLELQNNPAAKKALWLQIRQYEN